MVLKKAPFWGAFYKSNGGGTEIYPFGHKLLISIPLKNINPHSYRTRIFIFHGGGTEIRTLGTLRHGSFQDCCIKPLCHPSVGMWGEYIEVSLFVKIILEYFISDWFSFILVMKFEHSIWNYNSIWTSEF